MSTVTRTTTWTVTLYRNDSETPVVYDNVKHYWWEDRGARLVVSVLKDGGPQHYYWIWPVALISHVRAEHN